MRTFSSQVLINVGHGVAFPQGFKFRQETLGECPMKLEIKVDLAIESGRFILRAASMESVDRNQEINGTLVRSIQFNELMTTALDGLHYFDIKKNKISETPALEYVPENRLEIIADGPSPDSLAEVAKIYRIATVMRAKQTLHVQRVMQIPYPTAANWITRARKLKLIEASDNPKFEIQKLHLPADMDYLDFVDGVSIKRPGHGKH